MDFYLNIFLIFSFSIYAVYIIFFLKGLKINETTYEKNNFGVSIIVPAYNEEKNILNLLNSLKSQDYINFEVIIVDDNSTDKTFSIAQNFCKVNSNFNVIKNNILNDNLSPKILALEEGISLSKNNFLFFTDADCIVEQNWIKNTLNYFKEEIGLVTGATIINKNKENFFYSMQQHDYASHNAICAGTIGQNLIVNSNGTNFAIRRNVLDEIGGLKSVAKYFSGEDSFLAQKLVNTKWKISFNYQSIVKTFPVEKWNEYFKQRIRWSAQTKTYPNEIKFFLFATALLHVLLFYNLIFIFGKFNFSALLIFFLKSLIDYFFLKKYFNLIRYKSNFYYFLFEELFHIPTTLYIAFMGYFTNFSWKNK